MGYSLFFNAVEARPSVTSISVHLHIENTTPRCYRGVAAGTQAAALGPQVA